jgi:hypothetical protein
MKVRLTIEKDRKTLYEHTDDVWDAESFGKACANAWMQLREQRMAHATSIGALFEELDDQLLNELSGASISLARA